MSPGEGAQMSQAEWGPWPSAEAAGHQAPNQSRVHLSGRLEDRQQIPHRLLPAGGAVPVQRLEVGPCKLVTSLREEEEGMQGRRQLFL